MAPSDNTGLSIQQPNRGELPASVSFRVEHIEITGNSKIDTASLRALVASSEGLNLNLPQLGELAARITDYYHAHGYPLARAIIPAQTMQSGVVRIEVIEARYGTIGVDNQSRVSDRLLQATLDGLRSGSVVTQDDLDRSLLLLSDIPGLSVDAILKAGTQPGTSDLRVNTSSTPTFMGSVVADNGGDRYTGRERLGATVNVFNPLHQGDVLGVSGLTSGSGMNYGRLSYDVLLGGTGTRLGGAYSTLDYKLKGGLSDLDAQGTARAASLWVNQPLIRSPGLNLFGQLEYSHLQLDDDIRSFAIHDKRNLNNVTASLSGNVRDGVLAGATNAWNASWTYGHVDFDDAAAQGSDAATTRTQGGFSKGNVSLLRLQNLGANNALYFSLAGQWASGNLDPSQKVLAGGPNSVRAYDVGVISGDVGYLYTAELRHDFAQSWYGQWQAVTFFDAAHIVVNRNALSAHDNIVNLSGAGVGLNWAGANQLTASLTLAVPIGAAPEQIGSRDSVRAWLQMSKGF